MKTPAIQRLKSAPVIALTATALLSLGLMAAPRTASAVSPELHLPNFSHLQSKARESVDITLDGFLMRIAKAIASHDDSNDPALALLSDIKSVQVKSFEFDSDDAYSKADVDAVRKQLQGPGWSAIVQAHKREARENVDVFICMEGDKILGLAVIASEPRSFTVVNVIGSIGIDKLAQLEGQFGIPKVSTAE